jgi:hypothetical protein
MANFAFKWLPYWAQNYGKGGIPDQRAVQDFMDCETVDAVQRFRSELYSISQGNFDERIVEIMVGQGRKTVYQSYEEWSRLMLMWMVSYKS